MKERRHKVLVTDGNNRAALAITRSLGRAGYEVYVAAEHRRSLAGSSRYCRLRCVYTDPNRRTDLFRADIVRLVRDHRIDILMPAAEITTRECMKLKHELQGRCVVPFHSYEAVDRAASKFDIVNLARSLQVPIPCTHYLHKPADLENTYRFCAETGYPIVVKASRSRVELAGDNVHATTQYANNAPELHSVIQSFDPAQFPLLIQERVQGDGVGIFACFDRGRAIAYFAHHRIREKPPSGGVSVLRESIAVDEELKSYSERLLQALQWHGVAMVEFKSDAKHGGFKLMEINGRFWGSLQLAIDAGVDFPLLLARIAMDEKVEPVSYYRLNVRTRWLWGDADSLLAVLFKSRRQLHLPDHFPGKKQYLKEFLRLRSSDLNFEVLKMNDPMPWFLETMQWLHLMR